MRMRWARDGLYTVAAFAVTAVVNYAFSVLMGRWLPPAAFGRLSVALTLYMLGATVLVSGLPWALARAWGSVPTARERLRLLKAALLGNAVLAVALVAVLGLGYGIGWIPLDVSYRPLLALVALAWLLMGPQAVFRHVLRAQLRLDAFAVMQVLEAVAGLAFGVLAVRSGWGAVGGVGAQAFAVFVTLVVGMRWAGVGIQRLYRVRGDTPWRLLGEGVAFFVGTAGITYLMQMDVLGVRWFGGPGADAQAGRFQVAAALARPPAFVALALANAVLPHLVRARGEAGRRLLKGLGAVGMLGLLPLHAILAAGSEVLVRWLFPPAYAQAGAWLRVLAWTTLPLDGLFLTVVALQARGYARVAAAALMLSLGIEWLGMRWAVPRWGALGAGYALGVAGWLAWVSLWPWVWRAYFRPAAAEGATKVNSVTNNVCMPLSHGVVFRSQGSEKPSGTWPSALLKPGVPQSKNPHR